MSINAEIVIKQELDRAMQLHRNGKLPKAEKIYRNILATSPKHPIALHYLGLVALQVGKLDFAIDLIKEAIEEAPQYIEAHGNLGNAYQAKGQINEAIESFQKALDLDDNIAIYWANKANARTQLNQYEAAILDYQKALKLNPELAEVHRNLAMLHLHSYKIKEAIKSINSAYKLQPTSLNILVTKGNIHKELYQFEDALHCFKTAASLDPSSINLICNLASMYSEMQKGKDALDQYDKVLLIAPQNEDALFGKALVYQQLGDGINSETQIRKLIAFQPFNVSALSFLANLRTHSEKDTHITKMLDLISGDKISQKDRIELSFALGKVFSDLNEYENSFNQFNEGNRLKRRSFKYSSQTDIDMFEKIKNQFPIELITKFKKAFHSDAKTIFIIGMPRSGTTLVEQILNSHSNIQALGELSLLKQCINQIFYAENNTIDNYENISSDLLEKAGKLYIEKIEKIATASKILINKLPMNFLYVGLIKLILPNAIIIHCKRQPLDTCLSIYKNNFSKIGHKYAYEQKELGIYYNLYLDLIQHWEKAFESPFVEIIYEDLILEQEITSKKLVKACGLNWESACLEFFKQQRQINTLSVSQVRQPIYSQSVGKWKYYSPHLTDLKTLLK